MSDNNKGAEMADTQLGQELEGVLDLQDGETINDAIMRRAAEIDAAKAEEKPTKPKKEKKVTVSDPSSGSPRDPNVWQAIHIYQREGEPEGVVRSNATRERKMHGPSILIFAHIHSFGDDCVPACRERVAE